MKVNRAIVIAGAVVVSCGFALQAGAAPRYTKKESSIEATQTALTKPAQAKKDEKKKPEIQADDIFQGVGQQIKSVTDQQINVLKRLIDNTSDSDPEKPDLLYRMAELYAEQQRYYNFRARELDAKIFDAMNKGDNALADKLKKDQASYQQKENQWLLAAVKQYIQVVDNPKFEKYKRMDQVLFYLAYLLNQVKKEEAARKYFKRLIKDYPSSIYLPDAYLSFGEYYFENKEFENAIKFYDKVLQYPDSRVYGFAKYKEGWVYYNLGDFKQAMAVFVDVVEYANKPVKDKGQAANRKALQKEARKDIVRTYARLPGANPEKAWPFFQRTGGDYAPTMMELLGELYNSQGMFEESIKVYRQLMSLFKDSPKICNWQTEVMRNTLSKTGSRAAPDTVKELQRLAAVYDKYKDQKGIKADLLEECRDNTANTLRELATVWHKEAQKTNNNDTYALAQYLYKEYIKNFPKQKDIYVMTYYYGELLFKLGTNGDNQKFCEAAPVYTDVVKLDPDPKAKYLKDAAYAAVISWKNCLSVEDSKEDATASSAEKRKEQDKTFAEKKIPDRQLKMIEAFDTYIKYVPESKELPSIKYRKARIYYEYNHIDEAIPLFEDLAYHHRDSDLAIYSANLLLDCLLIKKQFNDIEKHVDTFLAAPELQKDADFVAQMQKLKAGLLRKRIELCEKDKKSNPKECADLYVVLATKYPNDPKIDEIYYNAAVLYEKSKLLGLAIQLRQQLIQNKPESSLAKKAIYLIGRNFQDVAAFEEAAKNYETFAEKYPGEKEAATALNTASFFRRGLGEYEQSMKDVALFVKNYGGRKEYVDQAAGVQFFQYQIFEQQRDKDRLRKHFLDYLKNFASKGGIDRQIIAHVKLGELAWKESCPVAGVNGACIELQRVRSAGAARVAAAAAKAAKKEKGKKKKKGANLPAQCGPETKSKIIVHERKPALVKEAMGHFAEALKLWKGGAATKSVPGKDETERAVRITEMTYYAAQARMAQGDQEYEKLLSIKMPEKLDFSPPQPDFSPAKKKAQEKKVEESKKAFKKYMDDKGKQLATAQKTYQDVIKFANAHWAIAASARIGQLFQDFSGQLYTAPVPKAPPAPGGYAQDEWEQLFHDAYCDQLTDAAEPLENKAVEGLGTCLGKSTELSWFNEWSSLCESELNQIKPAEYPLAAEIRAEPGYYAVSTDRAQVQALETEK
jgi:tetratricopeptide (TPR) repeat protein